MDLIPNGALPDDYMKVVINRCYGGFSVSLKALEYMIQEGSERAKKELADYKEDKINPPFNSFYGMAEGFDGHGFDRFDPFLIDAVETLGSEANGQFAQLKVILIPDDVEWVIEQYDGLEWVAEVHRTWG